MLKTSLSPNSKKTKHRKLLSLNRPHNITPKLFDDTFTAPQSSLPQSSSQTATSPPMTLSQDTFESTEVSTTNTLGEYHCPICNEDLSKLNTSYSRQQHIDGCLSSTNDANIEENGNMEDDQSLESLFMNYCSFCGKSMSHLKGVHKERHFDQCLTALETEQRLAEQHQQLTTYAGHSIPFLQDLDVCPVCHDILPGPSLRNKISHIKRCAKQRSLTMEQLLRKIQWMQWGHLPIQNTASTTGANPDTSLSSSSSSPLCITTPSINFSIHATEPPPINNTSTATTSTRSTPSLNVRKRTMVMDYTSPASTQEEEHVDDDFKTDVQIYKMASWQQTRFKKTKVEPTEDESIAMALSLSLMNEDEQQRLSKRGGVLSKRKKQKVNLDVANIVSIEESRALAKLALEKMLKKHTPADADGTGDSLIRQFPLVTSHVQPTLPRRQTSFPAKPLSISSLSLWSQASCLD